MKFLLLLLCYLSLLSAQTYEEFLKAQNEAFSSFKEERDREFSNYLTKEWKAYKESQGLKAYEEEKPLTLPKAKVSPIKEVEDKVLFTPPEPVHKPFKSYAKIIVPPVSQTLKPLYLNYFGSEITLHYDQSLLLSMNGTISKDKIADGWKKLAKSKYEKSIEELKNVSDKLRLNDWGRYLLIKQFATAVYKNDNEINLFTWFALLKLGYDAHISFQANKLILLVPVKGDLFSTTYYTLEGRRYYAVDYYAKGALGSIMTYNNTYTGADKALKFALDELPLFAQDRVEKNLVFRLLDGKNQSVSLEYDKNLLHFFQTYPQVSYTHYFSAPESTLLDKSVKASFEPLLQGKGQSEALDLILAFVQKAFAYKVDTEQFNREKVMFPSETIFYPYSDCEDRAILFSYMVKTLLGLDVVGLKYSSHMATAVGIQEKAEGEYVSYKKRAYIVADPTYINAQIGLSMPKYRGNKSYIIIAKAGK